MTVERQVGRLAVCKLQIDLATFAVMMIGQLLTVSCQRGKPYSLTLFD